MQKYLLYIDILGFSNLLNRGDNQIQRIYSIIDGLNVHKHEGFKTIVFSDTILVYNDFKPETEHDHRYAVMFMCEFAQDLMYRSFLEDVYFRAILLEGDFDHYHLNNIECFYGTALVDAYQKEKDIIGIGLFMDNWCKNKSHVFHTEVYDKELNFVYLQQHLDTISLRLSNQDPFIDTFFLDQEYLDYYVVEESSILKRLYTHMNCHSNPHVRSKFLTTWYYIHKRHTNFIEILIKEDFNYRIFNRNYDWSKVTKAFDKNHTEQGDLMLRV